MAKWPSPRFVDGLRHFPVEDEAGYVAHFRPEAKVSSPGSGCGTPLQMAGCFMAKKHQGEPTYLVTVMILQVVYLFLND